LEHVFGPIDTFVFAYVYPESVEVGGSEGGGDTLHAVMAISRSSEPLGHDVNLVTKRIVDANQTLGGMEDLVEDLLDRGARHIHEGFCMIDSG